ncbi:MAG: carboxypeptidase-like regulatory domain-containing protein [Acidimicrobiia bacterium]|nr:carboxypeptidase-like regulatory domain-containing protein [Acidimicrobiia bacterium]
MGELLTRATVTFAVLAPILLALSGCGSSASDPPGAGGVTPLTMVTVTVVAGPLGPPTIDRSDDTDVAPVEAAEVEVIDSSGARIDTATSDADGRFTLELAPGRYELRPAPVEGYLGTPEPLEIIVVAGSPDRLTLMYDTGIR